MFNITNYAEHPTNRLYTVYKFKTEKQSQIFRELLTKDNIYFEFSTGENSYGELYLVAIKNKDERKATVLNYITLGRFRKPFINNKKIQVAIYIVALTVLSIAIVGAIISG